MPKNISNWDDWKSRNLHKNQNFIEDGAVDINKWAQEETKILFLMKEAYGGISDLRTYLLRKSAKGTFGKAATFYNVLQWADAIRKVNDSGLIPDFDKYTRALTDIDRLAIVNIKKSNGGNSSTKRNLKAYVNSDWDLLEEQILNLKPNFIVCCGTFDLIKNKISHYKDSSCRQNKLKWEKLPSSYLINYIHPATRSLKYSISYYGIASISSPV